MQKPTAKLDSVVNDDDAYQCLLFNLYCGYLSYKFEQKQSLITKFNNQERQLMVKETLSALKDNLYNQFAGYRSDEYSRHLQERIM